MGAGPPRSPRLATTGRPRPRTVLFVHPSSGGYGADRQLELLATGLDPQRFRALVVLPERGALGARLEAAGVEVVTMPLATLRRDVLTGRGIARTVALARRNRRELADLARTRRAAVIHTNTSVVLAGAGAAAGAGVPHVQHVREIYDGLGGPAGRPLWRLLRGRIERADAVVCVSQAVARQFGVSRHVRVVEDALARSGEAPSRADARRLLDLADDAFAVAAVGRISDWKGQEVLVRALAGKALSEVGAVGLVVGDAAKGQRHFERALAELGERLGLDGRLRLLGFREDVEVVLAAADAVAVPSVHPDALPNAAIEAGGAGLPVVAARVGGLPEIVRDDATGWLVAPGDAAALAAALRRLADDPARARALGAAGARDVARRFSPARLLDDVQALYDELIDRPDRAPAQAWLLPARPLRASHAAAPELRIGRFAAWLREAGFDVSVLPPPTLRGTPTLLWRVLRERPALVLAGTAHSAPALAAAKRMLGTRVTVVADVIGLHSLEVDQAFRSDRARPAARLAWTALERLFCRCADQVVAVNDRHAAIVRRRYRPGGVRTLRDTAEPELVELPPTERAAIGIAPDSIAIGFVGSLVYGRLEPLLAAWELLEPHGKLVLVIAGDGPDADAYRARAARRGWLGRSVVFLGGLARADALAALRACDIAYSDCWSEAGFPAKLFEYMALGLPIVTEATPQLHEVLGPDDVLTYATTPELAARLAELAADPGLRARLGQRARAALCAGHTPAHRELELEALLDGADGPAPRRERQERGRPDLVSVVLPVRNGEEHLEAQLAGLAAQGYTGAWELLVVDNGCTDGSIEIVERWRDRLPSSLRIVDARERAGLNRARNRGAEAAAGSFLAFCDADDVVEPGWLAGLVEAGLHADLVEARADTGSLNDPVVHAWRPSAPRSDLELRHGFLPSVSGGNCGMWAEVAREIGWDESFVYGSSDIEFAWRAQLAGYTTAFAPAAVLRQRYRPELRAMLRQYYRYGKSEPQLYRRFRRCGLRRPTVREALRAWWRLARRLPELFRGTEKRGNWLRLAAHRSGRLVGSARRRVFFP